ncbi:Yip1 member 1 [Paramecium bursaria]
MQDEEEIRARIQQLKQSEHESSWREWFTLEYYQQYFDVTTELVLRRLMNAFNPFSGNFFDIGQIPELYGPFWILNTLIFTITLSSNISKKLQREDFTFDFTLIPWAFLLFYSKAIIIPLIYRVVLKCFSQDKLSYIHCVFLYGYSTTVIIPVTLLGCIPHPAIQWMLLLYGIFSQASFLATNFNRELQDLEKEKKYIIVAIVTIIQISVMIVYKFYFFKTENYEQLGISHIRNHFLTTH